MGEENPSWDEGRIEDELSLKLGILVDSRTVGKYMKDCNALGDRLAAMVCFLEDGDLEIDNGSTSGKSHHRHRPRQTARFSGGITAARLRPCC